MPSTQKIRDETYTEEELKKALKGEREPHRRESSSKSGSKRGEVSRQHEMDSESRDHHRKRAQSKDVNKEKQPRREERSRKSRSSSKDRRKHRESSDKEKKSSSDKPKREGSSSRSKENLNDNSQNRRKDKPDRDQDKERKHRRRNSADRDEDKRQRRNRESVDGKSKHSNERDTSTYHEERSDKHRDGDQGNRKSKEHERHRHRDDKERSRHRLSGSSYDKEHEPNQDEEERISERQRRKHHHSKEGSSTSNGDADHHRRDYTSSDHRYDEERKKKERKPGESGHLPVDSKLDKDEEGEDNYEDDFEDYNDDDFEDDEDEQEATVDYDNTNKTDADSDLNGIAEVMKAINKENDLVLNQPTLTENEKNIQNTNKSDKAPTSTSSTGRINFVLAKQNQITKQAATRTRNRGKDLSKLIELDVRSMDLFELRPMNEYELYMNSFGQSDSVQVYTQTGDDDIGREVQTEVIETVSRWCQYGDDIKACGIDGSNDDQSDLKASEMLDLLVNVDSMRLSRFLTKASQVCLSLLDEQASSDSRLASYKEIKTPYSDGHLVLQLKHPLIQGRTFLTCCSSHVQPNLVLVAYGPVTEKRESGALQSVNLSSLVCLWDVFKPKSPKRFFTCVSKPRCCCFSPNKASTGFAGLDDGSVVVFDFRENSSLHQSYMIGAETIQVGMATFSTAGSLDDENHTSPVVAIEPMSNAGSQMRTTNSFDSASGDTGLSYQLATVEEHGNTIIWIVIEIEKADLAGSETELGLCPGGKVKIGRSAMIPLAISSRKDVGLMVSCLAINPTDTNHFYVGSTQGVVLHKTRFGGRCFPKQYNMEPGYPVSITAIDVSPFSLDIFLVGCQDGSLRLHTMSEECPSLVWSLFSSGTAVNAVKWSRSKPNVFFVITGGNVFHVWDLLQKKYNPLYSVELKKRILSMLITDDYSVSGHGTPNTKPSIMFALADDTIEVHHLSNQLTRCRGDELDLVQSMMLHAS